MVFVRRYWVAGLVILLVVIHAAAVGYVRSEASRVRIAATNEIPAGVYYIMSPDQRWMTQLRVHLLVKPERRLEAKATIEHNRWLVHETIEEKLRQMNPDLLRDVALLEVKTEIKKSLDELLRDDVVTRVLVNDRIDIPANRSEYPLPRDVTEPEPIYTSTKLDSSKNDESITPKNLSEIPSESEAPSDAEARE